MLSSREERADVLSTIKKIGPVLELFTPERPEWRMTEIARALEMPKSSAHSLVTTLAEVGLLSTSDQGGYRLGWNILSLSERMRASLDFRKHALPVMQQLAESVQETVLLATLDRQRVIYLERAEGNHPMVRLAGVRVGSKAPAHCTSVGKILLAFRDPDEVRALFAAEGLRAMTKRTITDLDEFLAELTKVRSRGLAYDLGEIVPDISCVAAPVQDRYGSVVAAISVPTPAYRFEQKRDVIVEKLQKATADVSSRLTAAQIAMAESAAVVDDPEIAVVA
jgi:DNA-binding IclR family transcriptional regulator